jgi:hypothetical protein
MWCRNFPLRAFSDTRTEIISRSNSLKQARGSLCGFDRVMKDEKLYTQFGSIRSGFLATLIFNFLTLGGSLDWTGWGIFMRYVSKIQNLITFLKLAHSSRYTNWNLQK